MPPPSKRSRAWSCGFEQGSVMSKLSRTEQKAIRAKMKADIADRKAFERTARLAGW
jgi:hypothetical protein